MARKEGGGGGAFRSLEGLDGLSKQRIQETFDINFYHTGEQKKYRSLILNTTRREW